MKKGICFGSVPGESLEKRFKLAKNAGFDGIEIGPLSNAEERKEYKSIADAVGLEIHSIMNQVHWSLPITDPDPEVRRKSIQGMITSLDTACAVGADAVLLVPAVVNEDVPYDVAYERSQAEIRPLIKEAEERNVLITVENVWNNFLLSPLEFARYVDEFESDYVQAYFDVGNIVIFGYPEQWIRILGKRIKKVHVKGFNANERRFTYLIEDCTINWNAVMEAFCEVGYDDYMTAELPVNRDDPEGTVYNISKDMDKIIAGI